MRGPGGVGGGSAGGGSAGAGGAGPPRRRRHQWELIAHGASHANREKIHMTHQPMSKATAPKSGWHYFRCGKVSEFPSCHFGLRERWCSEEEGWTIEVEAHDHDVCVDPDPTTSPGLPHRVQVLLDHKLAADPTLTPEALHAVVMDQFGRNAPEARRLMHIDHYTQNTAKLRTQIRHYKGNHVRVRPVETPQSLAEMVDKLRAVVARYELPATYNLPDFDVSSMTVPFFCQRPDEAIKVVDGRLQVHLQAVFPTVLRNAKNAATTCVSMDESGYANNTSGVASLVAGWDDVQKGHHTVTRTWVMAPSAENYKGQLDQLHRHANKIAGYDFAESITITMSDHCASAKGGTRAFFQERGMIVVEAGQIYDGAGQLYHDDFDASSGHVRSYKEITPGLHVICGDCAVHVLRYLRRGKTAWLQDDKGKCAVQQGDRADMERDLDRLYNHVSDMDIFNVGMQLFCDKWVEEYPAQIAAFRQTSYFRGGPARAFSGLFNDNNPLEQQNSVMKRRLAAQAGAPLPLPLDVEIMSTMLAATNFSPRIGALLPAYAMQAGDVSDHIANRITKMVTRSKILGIEMQNLHVLEGTKIPYYTIPSKFVRSTTLCDQRQMLQRWEEARDRLKIVSEQATRLSIAARTTVEPCLSAASAKRQRARWDKVIEALTEQKAAQRAFEELQRAFDESNRVGADLMVEVRQWAFPSGHLRAKFMAGDIGQNDMKTKMERWYGLVSNPERFQKEDGLTEYLERCNDFHMLGNSTLPDDSPLNVGFSCTCPYHLKLGVCKHAILLGTELGDFVVDAKFCTFDVNGHRPRGRKRKASASGSTKRATPSFSSLSTEALHGATMHVTKVTTRSSK